jgi:hypothetical protein
LRHHLEALAADAIRRFPQGNQAITDGVIFALTLDGRGYGGWRFISGGPIAWRRGLLRPHRPTCRQRPDGMLAMPPRHRRQRIAYSTLFASARESIPLRHCCYDLAPRAHADPVRHPRQRSHSLTPPHLSADNLR